MTEIILSMSITADKNFSYVLKASKNRHTYTCLCAYMQVCAHIHTQAHTHKKFEINCKG